MLTNSVFVVKSGIFDIFAWGKLPPVPASSYTTKAITPTLIKLPLNKGQMTSPAS